MLKEFFASQLKRPSGPLGILASKLMLKKNQKNYDTMVKNLNVQPQDKILEIGYGPGAGIKMIAESCPTCTIDGIDFSDLMHKRATKCNKKYVEEGRVSLSYGDFLQVHLPHDKYDKVFCLNVIYFWNELSIPFGRVFSSLKENGSFHIYMAGKSFLTERKFPDSVFNKYSIGEVTDMMKKVGFRTVEHIKDNGHFVTGKVL
jgi:cyclopropane fatty-acyl-phospholipid synthase-like methyltransferase